MRSLLCCLAVVLVLVATGRAQPRDCEDTGDTCRENCWSPGRYQWCGSCEYYLDCTQGDPFYPQCPNDFVWNDNLGVCAPSSPTCVQCVIPAAKCGGTGPTCLQDCLGQFDGVYQWCGRCDYFLQCTGGATTITKCQSDTLFYDDNFKACLAVSSTCTECTAPPGPCASRPCHNGGICHDNGDGTYWCECPPGYTGPNCDDSVCLPNPCLNGGLCYINGGGGWFCVCPPGWTGPQCQTPEGACASAPCQNGGVCVDNPDGSWYCQCSSAWTGRVCESQNFQESCGSMLFKSASPAANGFTIYCYFQAAQNTPERNTPCSQTLQNLPIWGNERGLLDAGGNYGCLVSTDNNPHDPNDSGVTCTDYYQHNVALGDASTEFMMVCVDYPYEGINAPAKGKV